jgi:hypothetical protein
MVLGNASLALVRPGSDATVELGNDTFRWERVRAVAVVTGDLELKSEDGTKHWLIEEGQSDVFFTNKINGKRYRAVLEEVS